MSSSKPNNIIILGSGSTGGYLAQELSIENNVILVDKDITKINQLKNKDTMDIMAISGDAADLTTFNEIDLNTINFFIACTNDDQLNLLTAMYFERIPGIQTVVVLKESKYKDYPGRLGFPEIKTFYPGDIVSEKIVNLFETPYSWETDKIADSKALFLKVKIEEKSDLVGRSIYSLNKDGENKWKFIAITEDAQSEKLNYIKAENTTIRLKPGDVALVLLVDEYEQDFEKLYFAKEEIDIKNIFIVGQSYISENVAKKLINRKCNVKILASDKARARELSESLNDAQIIYGEPTNKDLYIEHGVNEECDYFLALTDDDEINVLSALLSNKLKAKNSLVVYSKSEYQNIINSIGAEREVNVKYSVAGEINSYIMRKKFAHETIIDENTKVFEFKSKRNISLKDETENIVLALLIRGKENNNFVTDLDDRLIAEDDYAIVVTLDQDSEKRLESLILE
jgi:trk system potassium uptake protein TrkA|tara:strand:+ start:45195 stop:46562 length:1368 start_codon:yes stop_codon:yes gene_type:complete